MASYDSLFDPRSPDEQGGGLLGGYPWPAPGSGPWPGPWLDPPAPTALQDAAAIPAPGGTALRDVAPQPLSQSDLYLSPVPQAPTWEQTVTTATPWSPLAKPPSATSWGELTNGIDCRTSDGNTHCITPGGHQFDIAGAFADGLTIAPGQPRYHYYSTPDGPVRFDPSALTQGVIDNPTVGPPRLVHPATPQGTLNEATPPSLYDAVQAFLRRESVYPPSMAELPFNPVKSYLTKDQNGLPMVVNITQPEHGLDPGVVARYVTESPSGATIQNEGSGLGWLQQPGSRFAGPISEVWQGHAQEIMGKMRPGSR